MSAIDSKILAERQKGKSMGIQFSFEDFL